MNKCLKILGCTAAILLLNTQLAFADGAIAVNDAEGTKPADVGYGIGGGDTKADAEANAMKQCKDSGNDQCKVMISYTKCGAYAGSYSNYGIGKGDTEEAAKAKALEQCANTKCKIIASACA
jgi:GTP cyclohydrolase III